MSYREVKKYLPEIEENLTIKPYGFLDTFLEFKGNKKMLSALDYPGRNRSYMEERELYIKRAYKTYKKKPTYKGKLRLISWAFMPE